jgi:hypothetical protein
MGFTESQCLPRNRRKMLFEFIQTGYQFAGAGTMDVKEKIAAQVCAVRVYGFAVIGGNAQ